jgi:CrcB protein
MAFLLVFIGGGVGSMLRYGISRIIPYAGGFPVATLIANLVSSLLLGYLLALAFRNNLSQEYRWLLMTGLCGGFSTFSTFSAENFQLLEEGSYGILAAYIATSVILGILAIFIGFFLGRG